MARCHFSAILALVIAFSLGSISHAQIFNPGFAGNGENGTGNNSVDFDLLPIINCQPGEFFELDPAMPPLSTICNFFLEELVDQLVESERFLDEVFNGYRPDAPRFFRNQLDGPVRIVVHFQAIDGPGGALAVASPLTYADFFVNPFIRPGASGNIRQWSISRTGRISLDVDDVIPLVLTELMIDVAVHEAFHAMGHVGVVDPLAPIDPLTSGAFVRSGLSGRTNGFGQINFLGDSTGINGVGYGLTEFRQESGNLLATFIPLSQSDGSAHLSAFEPTFVRLNDGFQEAFIPTAPPLGIQAIMSFSLQGMFADLGFRVRGVNSPGFIDIDNDGQADDPVVINPITGDHND